MVSKDNLISISQYWGNLRPGQNYRVLEEGRDWVKIRNNGKCLFVPMYLVQGPVSEKVKQEEEDNFEYDNSLLWQYN